MVGAVSKVYQTYTSAHPFDTIVAGLGGGGGLLGLVEVDGDVLLTTGGVGGVGAPVPLDGVAGVAGWVLPTAGLEETPTLTALTFSELASKGLPLATTLTPRLGLGLGPILGPRRPRPDPSGL